MDIAILTSIHPTEDPEKVQQAIRNLFPDAVETGISKEKKCVFEAANIGPLATRISEQKIRDTARVLLLRSIRGNVLQFHLNKQAAFAGKVNFTDGTSVLGDITIRITDDEPDRIARMIAGSSGL